MKLATKIIAGILLGVGIPVSLLTTANLVASSNRRQQLGAITALVMVGLPATAAGGGLLLQAIQQRLQTEQRLREQFFHLLRKGNGELTVLKFAMETGLDGDMARAYLDERAKEFNATFHVTEEGKFSYYFDLGVASALSCAEGHQVYDVVITEVVPGNQRLLVKTLQELLQSDWQTAKSLMQQALPIKVQQGVDLTTATTYRDRLEQVGAKVIIILQ